MRKDTIITRNKIISTAERLYAERGIDAVSLNEITREADQKNKSALSYHFGGKEGLLQAIIDKHAPGVLEAKDDLVAKLEAQPRQATLEDVSRIVVYSLASKLDDDDGGRYYLAILAQLAASNQLQPLFAGREYSAENDKVMQMIAGLTTDIPQELRASRLLQATSMLLHSLSYLARIIDKKPGVTSLKGHVRLNQVFIDNLVDSLVAIASVQPSQATQEALAQAV